MPTFRTVTGALVWGLLLATVYPGGTARAAELSFRGLGDLPGGAFSSGALALSADGSTVVGSSSSANGEEAFRWTAAGGMVGLGDLPGGMFDGRAWDVSADGSVIVGVSRGSNDHEAFRWTPGGGMVGLGGSVPGGHLGRADGVSDDGTVVVGAGGHRTYSGAYRWTVAGGAMEMGGGAGGSQAFGNSADGSVVTGYNHFNGVRRPFRWTSATGMVPIGDPPEGPNLSEGSSVSPDGSTIVGRISTGQSEQAFRWRSDTGLVGLGFLPGHTASTAWDASAGGSVVVGTSSGFAPREETGFVWDEVNGMRTLESFLAGQGVSFAGWSQLGALAVSADGLTFVGGGINPSGQGEAFIATIPEPAGLPLLALAGLLATRAAARALGFVKAIANRPAA